MKKDGNEDQIELLQNEFKGGHISKREFLLSMLKLGVLLPTAYALLDKVTGALPSDTVGAGNQKAEELRRVLGENDPARIVALADPEGGQNSANGVRERLARLREHMRRVTNKQGTPRQSELHAWVAWENEWPKWDNFDNWNNWDNTWGNWHNWGNTWNNK